MLERINESGMRPRYKIHVKINSTEEENTIKKFQHTSAFKIRQNFNMRRSKQITKTCKKQFFFLLFSNTGNILSKGKHQTKMSLNSLFSSFSFFLSFT